MVDRRDEIKVYSSNGYLKADRSIHKAVSKATEVDKNSNLELVAVIEKDCIGVYSCPDCDYRERASAPQRGKRRGVPPLPASTKCYQHDCTPVLVSCSASMIVVHYPDRLLIKIHHQGVHNHLKPPPVRSSTLARREFENQVKAAPERTPGGILLDKGIRQASRKIHPAYANADRVAKERKDILGADKTSIFSLVDLMTFEDRVGCKCIESYSFDAADRHVTLQTPFLKQILAEGNSCLQTDSVHGMILEPRFKHDINIIFTSGYCAVLKRTIPLVISIMLGMTMYH